MASSKEIRKDLIKLIALQSAAYAEKASQETIDYLAKNDKPARPDAVIKAQRQHGQAVALRALQRGHQPNLDLLEGDWRGKDAWSAAPEWSNRQFWENRVVGEWWALLRAHWSAGRDEKATNYFWQYAEGNFRGCVEKVKKGAGKFETEKEWEDRRGKLEGNDYYQTGSRNSPPGGHWTAYSVGNRGSLYIESQIQHLERDGYAYDAESQRVIGSDGQEYSAPELARPELSGYDLPDWRKSLSPEFRRAVKEMVSDFCRKSVRAGKDEGHLTPRSGEEAYTEIVRAAEDRMGRALQPYIDRVGGIYGTDVHAWVKQRESGRMENVCGHVMTEARGQMERGVLRDLAQYHERCTKQIQAERERYPLGLCALGRCLHRARAVLAR